MIGLAQDAGEGTGRQAASERVERGGEPCSDPDGHLRCTINLSPDEAMTHTGKHRVKHQMQRRARRLVGAIAALALIAPTPDGAQAQSQQARADSVFANFTATTPGASVVVVRQGEVVFRAGYGMANLDHGLRITPETVFDIASVSKQFGGFAISSLVESGAIDLDAPVSQYLPELPDFGAPLTVRHLVHHISGIRDWPITLAIAGWRFDDVISFDQILRMTWHQKELNFPPGDEYSYSNTGYNLLAEIVQRMTGESFATWTHDNIFGPLGMTNTHFQDDHTLVVPLRAQGYNAAAGGSWAVSPNGLTAFGSSSLHSSVDDMARWLINFDTRTVGGPAVIDRMHTHGVLNSGDTIAYAYGLNGVTWRGLQMWTHSGSWAGNRTVITHFPEVRSGVVILANSGVYDPTPAAQEMAEIFLGDLLGPDTRSPAPTPDARPAPDPAPELSPMELRQYEGDWVSEELDTHYVLSVLDGVLVADHYRHGRTTLTPRAPDRFMGSQFFLQPVRFERDAEGNVTDMFIGEGRARNLRFVRSR
ncbi:MAG: serine hydrolase [Gemmatimonadetes bacterium]|nr:serine hydrolase [Gemmatimonadota bacterium]